MLSKGKIPPGYTLIEAGKRRIIVKEGFKEPLLKIGITKPDFFLKQPFFPEKDYQGRGKVKVIAFPEGGDERLVIRHFQRGGKIQKFVSDLYFGQSRPLKELWTGYLAKKKGVPTVEIIAACHTKVFWKFHRGDLVTREIKGGKDLATYLVKLDRPLRKEKILEKRRVITRVGEVVRLMHDAGIFHGDLNLKNIILQFTESQSLNIYLIDWDKSFFRSPLKESLRIRNLLRLNRSAEKFKKIGLPITRTDILRFLSSYYQNSPNFKTQVKKLNRKYKWHIRLHQWGEKLF